MPPKRSNPNTMHRAGELRHDCGPAEVKLWAYLRSLREDGIRFRRQHAIGPYITDFCAPAQKLIIEVDGSQHLDQEEYDATRTAWLESQGYRVLRFWNSDVLNKVNGVMGMILKEVEKE
jgi:very-short-patch-repair endonuclease